MRLQVWNALGIVAVAVATATVTPAQETEPPDTTLPEVIVRPDEVRLEPVEPAGGDLDERLLNFPPESFVSGDFSRCSRVNCQRIQQVRDDRRIERGCYHRSCGRRSEST